MKLSVIILNWNSCQHLARCVASLRQQEMPAHELIVVDNGSQDGSVALLRRWLARAEARVIFNGRNRGVGPARNQALALARGEYVLNLDVDTEVQPGAVAELVRLMDSDPSIGLCAAQLRGAGGELQYTCRAFPTLLSKLCRQLPLRLHRRLLRRAEMFDWDHRGTRAVDCVIGACHMLRRAALNEVGLYDARIFYGPEDVDLCLRMWQRGWRVVYHGSAVIIHHERRITRGWRRIFSPLTWEHLRGLAYYFQRHGYLFRAPSYATPGELADASSLRALGVATSLMPNRRGSNSPGD